MGRVKEHAMGELDSRPQVMRTTYPPEPTPSYKDWMKGIKSGEYSKQDHAKHIESLIEMRVRNAKQRIDFELEDLEKDLVIIVANAIL